MQWIMILHFQEGKLWSVTDYSWSENQQWKKTVLINSFLWNKESFFMWWRNDSVTKQSTENQLQKITAEAMFHSKIRFPLNSKNIHKSIAIIRKEIALMEYNSSVFSLECNEA